MLSEVDLFLIDILGKGPKIGMLCTHEVVFPNHQPLPAMKISSLFLGTVVLILPIAVASAQVFTGNGGGGFGGAVGNGMLSASNGTNGQVNFVFTPGGGASINGDSLVIFLNTVAGGLTNTTSLTDNQDGGREAISGYNNANPSRTPAYFATGFGADFAISLEGTGGGDFASLYSLTDKTATTSNFHLIDGMAPTTGANNVLSFSLTRADLGLAATGPVSFTLEATLISTTAYRSNETFGASITTFDSANTGTAPNAGFTGSVTFTSSDAVTLVPEPGSLACVGLGAVALAGLAGCRARRASAA